MVTVSIAILCANCQRKPRSVAVKGNKCIDSGATVSSFALGHPHGLLRLRRVIPKLRVMSYYRMQNQE